MTKEQLAAIVPLNDHKLGMVHAALSDVFKKYAINTVLRQAHFLAQVLHESGGFVYTTEIWGPTPVQLRYEGRKDLGNIYPKDGSRFRGRGLIQITGRANYKEISKDLGFDFTINPEVLANYPWAMTSAGWYWDKRKLNELADLDDIKAVTKKVNGGLNGFDDRKKWLDKVKKVLQ